MGEVSFPLGAGQSEAVDPKLLPQGVFSLLANMRVRKDARLVSRYGLHSKAGLGGSAGVVSGSALGGARTANGAVFIRTDGIPMMLDASGTYIDCRRTNRFEHVGVLGQVERLGVASQMDSDVVACDTGYVAFSIPAPMIVVAYIAGTSLFVAFFRQDGSLYLTDGPYTNAANPRVVIDGTNALVTYADTGGTSTTVRLIKYSSPSNVTGPNALVTGIANSSPYYDVCLGPSGTLGIVYHRTIATTLSLSTVVWATLVATERATVATGNLSRASVAFDGSSTYQAVWIDGATFAVGNVKRQKYTTAGLSGGTTTLDSNGKAAGFPTCGYIASAAKFYSTWNLVYGTTFPTLAGVDDETSQRYFPGLVVVSRPGVVGSGIYAWCATGAQQALALGTVSKYMLVDLTSGCLPTFVAGNPNTGTGLGPNTIADAVSCQNGGLAGATVVTLSKYDTRRSIVSVPAVVTNSPFPSVAYAACSLPFLNGPTYGAAIIRLSSGSFGAGVRSSTAALGRVVFAGPRMREFDGAQVYEVGLGEGPDYVAVATAGGAIEAGSHQYVVVWEWRDAAGVRHRSPPSLPVTVSPGAPWTGTISFTFLPASDRLLVNLGPTFGAAVYRTVAGGTVFYRVATAPAPAGPSSIFLTVTDNSPDATITSNEILYTQGARGGLSGLLENDEPPPSAFVWAGNNRVVAGGLEDANQVQFSKLFFPGEPIQWSSDAAFRATVDAPVTAVCALDGSWYIFTRDSIWVVAGDGPDDNGSGSFADPVKLPSDVGCINYRSLVEVPQGVLFQARNDRLYLLPRGSNAPQWVGQAVRDTLTSFPFISSSVFVPDENCAYFACTTADGSLGVLIVHDTRTDAWYVDTFYSRAITSLAVWQGRLMVDGFIAQTPGAYVDDDTGAKSDPITQQFVTGDIRPFGPQGWGRIRKALMLGEFRGACTMDIEESVDSGSTWLGPLTYDYSSGFSAGARIETDFRPPIIRTDAMRLRVTISPSSGGSEALALNAMTIEAYQAPGAARQPQSGVR